MTKDSECKCTKEWRAKLDKGQEMNGYLKDTVHGKVMIYQLLRWDFLRQHIVVNNEPPRKRTKWRWMDLKWKGWSRLMVPGQPYKWNNKMVLEQAGVDPKLLTISGQES